jgi:para-aminobenzoate synthetase/4-amino-4-deoxychorismate lyase
MNARTEISDHRIARLDSPRPDPAQGVFETLLVLDGAPVELDAHLARLAASLEELYGVDDDIEIARDLIVEHAQGLALGRLRLDVGPLGPGATGSVRTAAVERAVVLPGWERALELAPVTVPGGVGAHKWSDRRLLERAEADAGHALPLLLDADGSLLEGSRGSLFLVHGEVISTPAADGRILPGVTRAVAIEAARAAGRELREEALALERLLDADEAFVTGAVRGVEPVRAVAGLRSWGEGAVTAGVSAELRRRWLA